MLHVILILLVFYAVCRGYTGLQMYCWRRHAMAHTTQESRDASPLTIKGRPLEEARCDHVPSDQALTADISP